MELFSDEKASSMKLLKLWLKNIKLILIFVITGIFVSIAITFFIPKKYISYAVVFPPNSNLGLNILEDPRFGNSLDADQLMQLLESKQVMDSVVKMFRLEEYYEVDRSQKGWKERLGKLYYRDVNFNKTRYYSVVVTVEMKDPELASDIANSIVDIVDGIRHRIIRENQMSAFEYAKNQFEIQAEIVDSIKSRIYVNKQTNDPDNILYNHLLDISKLNAGSTKPFVTTPELETLVESYIYEMEKLKNLKSDYHKAKRLIEKPLSKVFIVNRAKPNYKKVSPSFLINGMVGFSASLLFILVFIVFKNRYQSILRELKK